MSDIVDELFECASNKMTYGGDAELFGRAAGEIIKLRAELASARSQALEALRPFADEAGAYDPDEGDGDDICWATPVYFKIRDLRRARDLARRLAEQEGTDE